jgi:hypothetical protein
MSPVDDVRALSAEAAGYATPTEAGTIDLHATVTLTLEIAQ